MLQAEFEALYAPSLFRTYFNNPIAAFEADVPSFYLGVTSLVRLHVLSAAAFRFFREHPKETTGFRAKTLGLIADWSHRTKLVSSVPSAYIRTTGDN